MSHRFELLAPGGDLESILAAIAAGADAVYCGLNRFNARNKASNISFKELCGVLRVAHQNQCKVFLTLNIVLLDCEIPALIHLLNQLVNTAIDGVIVQDLGLFYLLARYFPSLDAHASTQLNTHNSGQIQFLSRQQASRVNVSRELTSAEIKALVTVADQHKMATEVFVHGSYCIGFSGLCYMSSVSSGHSGNRGCCSQPCRDPYQITAQQKNFPLNLKDNSAFFDVPALAEAGVYSLKIEGRMKKPHYVYRTVQTWRAQLDHFCLTQQTLTDNSALYTVFNRDFSNGYLKGQIHRDMFIDNPRDHAVQHVYGQSSQQTDEIRLQVKKQLYDEKTNILNTVATSIRGFNVSPLPMVIRVAGQLNTELVMDLFVEEQHYVVRSTARLQRAQLGRQFKQELEQRLFRFDEHQFSVVSVDSSLLDDDVSLSFSELNQLKKHLFTALNEGRAWQPAVTLEPLRDESEADLSESGLCVVVDLPKDVDLGQSQGVEVLYALPSGMAKSGASLVSLFNDNPSLIPYFPAVLIGEDYQAAIDFLNQLSARKLITNNTGIAHEAMRQGLPWVAGPQFNLTNSYSLLCLQEDYQCEGAFVSNEINKKQIKAIVKPKAMTLYYSLYHPSLLMMSRQCYFLQTAGCQQKTVTRHCLTQCSRNTSLINLNNETFVIDKQKGAYNCIYDERPYFNSEVVADFPQKFSKWVIDLRAVGVNPQALDDKSEFIQRVQQWLAGNEGSLQALQLTIGASDHQQYHKGL